MGTLKDTEGRARKALEEGVKALASMTHAKTMEYASEELKSTSVKFRKALSFQSLGNNVYVVSLDESMLWVEDGRKSGFMDELLKKNPHYSKDGNRYKAIPFDYSADTPKTQRTAFSAQMVNLVQAHLKKEGMHYKKLVTDRDGSPILGKIASYNIESPKPTAMSSTPALQALNVYQTMDANGETKKSFVAFRVISDKHAGTGKWVNPGQPARLFLDKSLAWAMKEWENKLLPDILNSIG